MRAYRWPAIVLVPVLLVGLLLAGRSDDPAVTDNPGSVPADLPGQDVQTSMVAERNDPSTWYCATGTGVATDQIDRTVLIVANAADEPRSGTMTVFDGSGEVTTVPVEVPAGGRWQTDLADHTEAAAAATLFEFDGGSVAVARAVFGPEGADMANCVSAPSPTWYIPAAASTLDAAATLTLFNPFPDDASLDLAFYTDEGVRVPTEFEGLNVPASAVISIDLTPVITVRENFSTVIEARDGQIIAEMVQTYDGSDGAEGLSLLPGAPSLSETWFYPAGFSGDEVREAYVIMNVGTTDAEVDVTVSVNDPEKNGFVQPFQLTVPRQGFAVLSSEDEAWARVPAGVPHSMAVRSQNGVPVVAAQLQWFGGDQPGYAATPGVPLTATRWMLAATDPDQPVAAINVMNPSPLTITQLTARILGDGGPVDLAALELAEGARVTLDLSGAAEVTASFGVFEGSTPIVVAERFGRDEGGRVILQALPLAGSTVVPPAVEGLPD